MNLRNYFGLVAILLVCVGCPNDDEGINATPVELRDRGEQSLLDDELLQEFLRTHFYNYEEFEAAEDSFDYIVVIDTIAGENSDKTPLLDRPELETITYDRFDASNTLYILRARIGGSPNNNPDELTSKYTDSLFMNFRGSTLVDGSVFDGTANPIWLDLPTTVDGFARGLEGFKGDPDGITLNDDGTTSFDNFGSGTVFIPSGLGFFNQPTPGIAPFSTLIFNFQVFSVIDTDHDGDLIRTIDEDIAGNNFLFDEEDNTDGDLIFNFRDPDDDNDGVRSRLEIMTAGEGDNQVFVAFLDTDNDGTPDHLDTDDDGDGRNTRNEIEVNTLTGEVSFPDSDGDGTPDYLDSDS